MQVRFHTILCIVGPSGCGKSTLLDIISGLSKANSGNIIIDGNAVKFAVNCKKYIDDVALSVVDIIGEEEVNKCKELCNKYDLKLKVRQFR